MLKKSMVKKSPISKTFQRAKSVQELSVSLVSLAKFSKIPVPISLLKNHRTRPFSSSQNDLLSDDSGHFSPESGSESILELDNNKGRNVVYFRNGVLNVLEQKRNRKLGPLITNFQAVCRGYLIRRISERKRVQDLAVRCIQKNVRAFFQVRSWSWWKLLVQIKPVLNVHRIEDELVAKTRDLDLVLSKVDRLEEANTKLRAENDKIQIQLSELTLDLAEERSSSALLQEKLENEYEEKTRLEEKLAKQQSMDYCSSSRGGGGSGGGGGGDEDDELDFSRKIANELDLFESNTVLATAALVSAANSIANDFSDDSMDTHQHQLLHTTTNQNIYKKRLESSNKEIGFLKKRIQEQHECDLEQMIGLKKQLEKKLSDAYEEIDEQRQVAQQWKKKFNKTVDEMSDLKLLLEQQNSRNVQLEKKQKKFDQELTIIMDDLRKEKVLKDRFHREREIINGEKFILESAISELKMEVQIKEEKIESLQREIDEASSSGLSSGEISILKKQKIDLENRVKDFEEELDEMAGQIQMLEQNKVRLEMNLEHSRRENRLESAHKDEELESMRNSYQKRLKSLEMQIETEREERSGLVREKRELERRLNNLLDLDDSEQLIDRKLLTKLKRNLTKLSVLYNDAKIELDQLRTDSKNKTIVRQLRNKIDDLETDLQQTTKLRQNLERELNENQSQIDEIRKMKCDAESKVTQLGRQLVDLQNQLDDNDEEISELQRKYEHQIEQITKESLRAQRTHELNVLESDEQKSHLIEHLTKLTSELEALVVSNQNSNNVDEEVRLKTKELESKLELEQMKRTRLETQINRLKDSLEKSLNELSLAKIKEKQTEESIRRTQKLLKETKDELIVANNKITDLTLKKTINEKKISNLESELSTNRTDLKIALKRIEDLQSAIRTELDEIDENMLDDILVQLNSGDEEDDDDEDEDVNMKNGDNCGVGGYENENGHEISNT